MKISKSILPLIVIAQFCCTSLWFAGNAVMPQLLVQFDLFPGALGHLTSAVQIGFIAGTLLFAVLSFADRFSPSRVFFVSALLGAGFNLAVIWEGHSFMSLISCRVMTGVFLAGIYPVGMKIAADYYQKGLGKSLGFLVGALVIGTAFPHLLSDLTTGMVWESVLILTSVIAVFGGVLIFCFVPDGPYRQQSQQLQLSAFWSVFKVRDFRIAALGYFGHMWELYAFWAFVPVMLSLYEQFHPDTTFNIALLSFLIIGVGSLSCVCAGYLSQRFGAQRIASLALAISGSCCLLSPWMFGLENEVLFICFLLVWGLAVIADSPLLSSLVAQQAPAAIKGTALTIVNCIGFAITIVSIQLLNGLNLNTLSTNIYLVLALGPVLGLVVLWLNSKSVLS
ncbi:MFS transporter [Psychroflexus montanilacus]|uniref:MFS transporter n=1 Tax=Psychroflexus montanilacus TaxID=2873598 RepID=UPI001CCB617B|nr:MFS transporter [Psychroflexus montanilacus]MBZ9652829.1 MFS transporter [Psychroflexus montanilacus]